MRNLIKTRIFALTALLLGTTYFGCQSQSNPWSGPAYQEPGAFRNPPQAIYAPMPSILPQIDAADMFPVESHDDELEAVLMDLEHVETPDFDLNQ